MEIYERPESLDGINLVATYDSGSGSLAVRRDPDPRAYLAFQGRACR